MYRDFKIGIQVPHQYPYGATHPSQQATSMSISRNGASTRITSSTSEGMYFVNASEGSGTTSSSSSTSTRPCQPDQKPMTNRGRRFLELCVNTGGYTTTLGEIEVAMLTSDGDLFERICKKYREIRGSSFKRLFMHPVNIHYVKFNVARNYRVGIRGKPIVLPPKDEVRKGNYAYNCPDLPPMDRNEFLHHFHRSAKDHPASVYIERLPKKLGGPLCAMDTQYGARAWGIHIIEGHNRAVITWCCVAIEIISFIVSVVYMVVMRTQEQGFSIGSWMLAVLATSLTALYFQWEEA
ncbi:hypothetical protein MMC10_002413 [Thelotrema lepadinum]|nr:hypothetical protein [Thelotrema lepadinum]